MLRITALLLLAAIGGMAAPAAAGEPTYTCYCEDDCGNGGLGANAGKVVDGAQSSTLQSYFGLGRAGYSSETGWACMSEAASYTCKDRSHTARQALVRFGSDALSTCSVSGAKAAPDRESPRPPKRPAGR